jgi:rRNA-processing protein FCF1
LVEVICDTSFLIVLASKPVKKLDVLENNIGKIDFIVPSTVADELNNLVSTASAKRANAARLALELAKRFKTIVLQGKSADEVIIDYASKHRCYVATIDNVLKNKLKGNGIDVITLVKDRIIVA